MKDIIKYRRGQVWFIDDKAENLGSIICKSRPYLIVSNDTNNRYAPVIHVAPITSQIKNDQPTHIVYYDSEDLRSTILCEQITIKSIPHISGCSRYMYTLSDDVMRMVDQAIVIQFGLLYNKAETIEDHYINSNSYTLGLNELASAKESVPMEDSQSSNSSVIIERTNTGRIRWTPELKAKFVEDSTILSEKTMMNLYGLKQSTYRTTLSKIKQELKKQGIRKNLRII